jgi:hypothetical protein
MEYFLNKFQNLCKISASTQPEPNTNYNVFKDVFKNLSPSALLDYYNNPPLPFFKTLVVEEFNVRDNLSYLHEEEYEQMSEDFIRELKDKMDWESVSICAKLSENCIREFQKELHWKMMSQHQNLSESFIREFQNKVDWVKVSKHQNLSESFIVEFQNKVDWKKISKHQNLSESFIVEFQNKLNWQKISKHQNLSSSFIKQFENNLSWFGLSCNKKLSRDIIREFQNKIDWVVKVKRCRLSEDFIREFKEKLDLSHVFKLQRHLSPEFLSEIKYNHTPIETCEDCSICLDRSESMIITKICKHIFCRLCIGRWLIEHDTCPLCRTTFKQYYY